MRSSPRSPDVPSGDDPVTLWIDQLRQGDDLAARSLWEHFFLRLYELAKHKLKLRTRPAYDEEDAAQSAFHSVCAGIIAGRFPELQHRDSLWRLILVITAQKISNRHRYDQRQCRDVRRNLSDSVFADSPGDFMAGGIPVASREPTPEFAVEFVEVCEKLFRALDDATLKEIATLKMKGYTDAEVADRLKCSRRTVQRRITISRRHWEHLETSCG
jgi:DNA-directed RNA polymerase specialized sigma24 family protein